MQEANNTQLFQILNSIEGNGSYEHSGVNAFVSPGLQVKGVGELALPAQAIQIKELIKAAHQAPYGQGSQTITNTAVRNSWEINADQLAFKNPAWADFLDKILGKVQKGLDLEVQTIAASLYKLLIYEKGGFFLPHKDSEKEKGMFGTLIVGLPSTYTGGEVVVRFGGEEEVFDLAVAASNYKMPHLAFFADCEHEIKPVRSGYRLSLVYNLVQKDGGVRIGSPEFSSQSARLTNLLSTWSDDTMTTPKAVLLGHQYTPANFSLATLKLNDLPRAETLIAAAEQAGYYTKLGLVTSYVMGQLEEEYGYYGRSRRRGRYYDDYEEEESSEGTMGEIYEESITIKHWATDGLPHLGKLPIEQKNILADIDLNEDDPIEQQQEGFTGNAGMTIEYWYHYGAVILWPKAAHASILAQSNVSARLEWLAWYLTNWENSAHQSQTMAKELLLSFESYDTENVYDLPDFSVLGQALQQINDVIFVQEKTQNILSNLFVGIGVEQWLALWQAYPPTTFESLFQKVGFSKDLYNLQDILLILKALGSVDTAKARHFVWKQLQTLAEFLADKQLYRLHNERFYYGLGKGKRQEAILGIVKNVIDLSMLMTDATWQEKVLAALTQKLPRDYVNEILTAILLEKSYKNNALAGALYDLCVADLKRRTAVKPTPPENWTRPMPDLTRSYDQSQWNLLKDFMASPTQQVFNYTKNESYRKNMAYAIRNVTVDLQMETIKRGRPYTLRITKTQADYKRQLQMWKEDMDLLDDLLKG